MEGIELISFQVISSAGAAKSNYIQAIEKAEEGDFERAEELIAEGYENYMKAHEIHQDLVTKEAGGEKVPVTLILTHAEDQLITSEVLRVMADQILKLRKEIKEINEK